MTIKQCYFTLSLLESMDSTTASLETLDSRTASLAALSSIGLEEKDPTATHPKDSHGGSPSSSALEEDQTAVLKLNAETDSNPCTPVARRTLPKSNLKGGPRSDLNRTNFSFSKKKSTFCSE